MTRRIHIQKEYVIISILMIMFMSISYTSFTTILRLQGNARVVNYTGIVRGATQKLVKAELRGFPDDALLQRLDSIVEELVCGDGVNNLVVINDGDFLACLDAVAQHWALIKDEIYNVRQGADDSRLFELSETYFELADQAVSAAEVYSENQVGCSIGVMIAVNGLFVGSLILGLIYFVRTNKIKMKADMLGKIAYTDPLTQMPNRASFEQKIDALLQNPLGEDIGLIMFDMNRLKLVNDQMGHVGGDRILAEFARILKTEAQDYGFVCRYGGDEFLAIFENADEAMVEQYLSKVNEKIAAYNDLHENNMEKLSFAAGYMIGNLRLNKIEDLINEADRQMYVRKRQMKEHRD